MNQTIKTVSACPFCLNHPPLYFKSDSATCNVCNRSFKLHNDSLIMRQDLKMEADLQARPFTPVKGQSNWRALNYYETEAFFSDYSRTNCVLDLGSGPSTNIEILKKFQDLIMLDFVQFSGVDIVCDFTKALPLQDNSIDLVLCSNVFEHMNRPRALMQEIQRALRPGGRVILTIPFVIKEHQAPYDFFRYTKYGIKEISRDSGLNIVEIKGIGGQLNIIATQLSLFKQSARKLNFYTILISISLLGVCDLILRVVRKFAGDLSHPLCPQGYKVILEKPINKSDT